MCSDGKAPSKCNKRVLNTWFMVFSNDIKNSFYLYNNK